MIVNIYVNMGGRKRGKEGGLLVIMVVLVPCGKSRQIWRALYLYVYIYIFFLKYKNNDQKDQRIL